MPELTERDRLDRLERAVFEVAQVVFTHFRSTNAGPRPAIVSLTLDVAKRLREESEQDEVAAEKERAVAAELASKHRPQRPAWVG
jgi:hypothetical protein